MLSEKPKTNYPQQVSHEWEVMNPEGVKLSEKITLNPHPDTLSGKTVVLTWNHKPNGDVFLNRLADLLLNQANVGKIIKLWELEPFTARVSQKPEISRQIAIAASKYKPDIIINAQCD